MRRSREARFNTVSLLRKKRISGGGSAKAGIAAIALRFLRGLGRNLLIRCCETYFRVVRIAAFASLRRLRDLVRPGERSSQETCKRLHIGFRSGSEARSKRVILSHLLRF